MPNRRMLSSVGVRPTKPVPRVRIPAITTCIAGWPRSCRIRWPVSTGITGDGRRSRRWPVATAQPMHRVRRHAALLNRHMSASLLNRVLAGRLARIPSARYFSAAAQPVGTANGALSSTVRCTYCSVCRAQLGRRPSRGRSSTQSGEHHTEDSDGSGLVERIVAATALR